MEEGSNCSVFNDSHEPISAGTRYIGYENGQSQYEIKKLQDVRNDTTDKYNSTNCTDQYDLKVTKTNRGKNGKKKKKENSQEEKNDDRKTKNSIIKEFNRKKKMMTRFQIDLQKKMKKNFKIKIRKIPYKVNTQGNKNYLINIFKLSVRGYLTQPLPNGKKNPNKDILNKIKIKNKEKEKEQFLQMNFLDAFYKFYNKLKKDADFREENNIDDAEFKEWEKIIEYKPKKKKNYEYNYEEYGIYQFINDKKERKAQNEYKIVDNNIMIENSEQTNQNVNFNLSLNKNENNTVLNNIQFNESINNYSNSAQTNQNVNFNSILIFNENNTVLNNIQFNESINNYSNSEQTNFNLFLTNNENNTFLKTIQFNGTCYYYYSKNEHEDESSSNTFSSYLFSDCSEKYFKYFNFWKKFLKDDN